MTEFIKLFNEYIRTGTYVYPRLEQVVYKCSRKFGVMFEYLGCTALFMFIYPQCDPVISERLMQSPDFSRVFNIVLHGQKSTISSHDMPGKQVLFVKKYLGKN